MLTVDDYHILQTSACVGFDVLLRMSTSFLLDIFWPLVHVEVSVAVSSFMSYWNSILHYLSHLCGEQSVVSVLVGRIWFSPNHSLLSAPILSSFQPLWLLRRERSLSLEGSWWIHVRVATCSVYRLTRCLCHSRIHGAHRKHFRFYILEPIKTHLLK